MRLYIHVVLCLVSQVMTLCVKFVSGLALMISNIRLVLIAVKQATKIILMVVPLLNDTSRKDQNHQSFLRPRRSARKVWESPLFPLKFEVSRCVYQCTRSRIATNWTSINSMSGTRAESQPTGRTNSNSSTRAQTIIYAE